MKKRISLFLCMLLTVFCFAGCSNSEVEVAQDTTLIEETAEIIILNFSAMSEEDFAQFKDLSEFQLNYTMMQTGLRVEGESFIAMIDSWEAAEEECGAFVSHGDYSVEFKNDEIVVSTEAQFENREATISFSFDEDSNLESLDVSAKFSIGEILQKAGLNTLLGMGTVFGVLIFLAFLIYLMKYIPVLMNLFSKKDKKEAAKEEVKAVETVPAAAQEEDDLELIAVITSAIAAQEGTSTDGFVVRSIRRRPSNNWN